MTLKKYLDSTGETVRAFATRAGLHAVAVGRYASGMRLPCPVAMRLIAKATGGRVLPNDFHNLHPRGRK